MLKQFKQLALETEGRYATEPELQFIKDYLQSSEVRISAYEKMRDREDELLDKVQSQALEEHKDVFMINNQNRQTTARRDSQYVMRHLATSVLAKDLERYRDGLLVWHRTIMNAQNFKQASRVTRNSEYQVLEQVLTEEEFTLAKSALMIGKSFLG
jgi:hypothetical protein